MTEAPVTDIYEPVIAQIRAQIEELERGLEVVLSLQAKANGGSFSAKPSSAPSQQGGTVAFSNDAFFGMTVAEAAKKYLSATKKTATVAAICDALVAGGWKTAAKNIPENVRTIIGRHADFARVNGEFGLAEWYPGRRNMGRRAPKGVANMAVEDVTSQQPDDSSEPSPPPSQ